MNHNPYAPPADLGKHASSSERLVGDYVKKLSSVEVTYCGVVLSGLMLSVHRAESEAWKEALFLAVGVVTFLSHCIVLLDTRGFVRGMVIAGNAMMILSALIWSVPQLVIMNLVVHLLTALSCFVWSYREARQLSSLLNLPDAIGALQKYIELKGQSALRLQCLAAAFEKRERVSEALDVMRRCLQMNPYNFFTHSSIACLLCQAGAYAEAEEAYGRLMKQIKNPLWKLLVDSNYCRLLAQTSRFEECRERLDTVEQSLKSNQKISIANQKTLAESIKKTRELLNQLSQRPT